MKIVIESIPHAAQRYDTLGDWWFDPAGVLQIRVSNDQALGGGPPDEREQFCIELHELVEARLCQERGITQKQVDDFDKLHLTEGHNTEVEPGDDPRAPYREEHRFAMIVEHLMARELGLKGYGVIR